MSELVKALKIRCPSDVGRAPTDFNVLKFAVTNASLAWQLPSDWSGRWVVLYTPAGSPDVEFAATCFDGPTGAFVVTNEVVDGTVPATAGSTTGAAVTNKLKVGAILTAGVYLHVELPFWDRHTGLFLAQSTGANVTVRAWQADGSQSG